MSGALTLEDFPAFFHEIHQCSPFPWQIRLMRKVAEEGKWPEVLDLPTGSGKTAALDVAVFHLALEAHRRTERRAPVRIALVVDRRLVVDDAFERARKIAEALAETGRNTVAGRAAEQLRMLAGENAPPLLAHRLRGGIPREDNWARTPSQPTILCSTVDQVGSRLLFRGYGVSNAMKSVHAGLIGTDCLILLDEAHLSEPFRQTLEWVDRYKGDAWREDWKSAAPWSVALLTATPGNNSGNIFSLDDDDRDNTTLARRLNASKLARLVDLSRYKNAEEPVVLDEEIAKDKRLISGLMKEALLGLNALQQSQEKPGHSAMAVVVNRVARARAVFEDLRKHIDAETAELILMIGASRPVDREALATKLEPIHTGLPRNLTKPLVIVATQCIEAGVDIDLDGLVTESAPIDALRQRFGRLNRDGRKIEPYASVVGAKTNIEDPVYGQAANEAWKYLLDYPDQPSNRAEDAKVDFGLVAFERRMGEHPVDRSAISPKPDAPVLLPAHLDLLSQTAPVPAADPDISLYLHGPGRAADSISVVWRADIRTELDPRRLLLLVPPRAAEAIELPIWAVRRWLTGDRADLSTLADIPALSSEDTSRQNFQKQKVFRWAGDDDRSAWVNPAQLRPGDTIIVPTNYGGVDEYGWNPIPSYTNPAKDVADAAAAPFEGRRFTVRVAPGLLGENSDAEALAETITANSTAKENQLRNAVKAILRSKELTEALNKLDRARGKVQVYLDVYGLDENDNPRGAVFVAPLGLKNAREGRSDSPDTTEDDISGSLPGFSLSLQQHCLDVEEMSNTLAVLAGLPEERIVDLKLAGYLHDSGKADPRFQEWLAYGDPLGFDSGREEEILAKSARPLPRSARGHSGLPEKWRHEALSVRLAHSMPRFADARDQELVLWLIGTHHGYGRPFFPHSDPDDDRMRYGLPDVLGIPSTLPPGAGPQSLAYNWNGLDWCGLYDRLKVRYGVWELARMEAILRLADHRASENEQHTALKEQAKNQ